MDIEVKEYLNATWYILLLMCGCKYGYDYQKRNVCEYLMNDTCIWLMCLLILDSLTLLVMSSKGGVREISCKYP